MAILRRIIAIVSKVKFVILSEVDCHPERPDASGEGGANPAFGYIFF